MSKERRVFRWDALGQYYKGWPFQMKDEIPCLVCFAYDGMCLKCGSVGVFGVMGIDALSMICRECTPRQYAVLWDYFLPMGKLKEEHKPTYSKVTLNEMN